MIKKNTENLPKSRITQIIKHLDHADKIISMEYKKRDDRIYVIYQYQGKNNLSTFPRQNVRGGVEYSSYDL